jgi:TnpA family transposase
VVENWNSANGFIFYGQGGELPSNRLEDQELRALAAFAVALPGLCEYLNDPTCVV